VSDVKTGRFYLSNVHGLVKLKDVRHNGLSGKVAIIEDEQGRIYLPSLDFFMKNASICEEADDPIARPYDIQWDVGTQDKSKTILVTVCPKCGSTVPADSVEKPALRSWAARFLKAVKGIEVSE